MELLKKIIKHTGFSYIGNGHGIVLKTRQYHKCSWAQISTVTHGISWSLNRFLCFARSGIGAWAGSRDGAFGILKPWKAKHLTFCLYFILSYNPKGGGTQWWVPSRGIWELLSSRGMQGLSFGVGNKRKRDRGRVGENFFPVVHRRGVIIFPSLELYPIPYGAHLSGVDGH